MLQNLRPKLAIFGISTLLTLIVILGVEQVNRSALDKARIADGQVLLELASHNLSPFVLSGDRLAAQAELDFLVDSTQLEYAAVRSSSGQLLAEAGIAGGSSLSTDIRVGGESAAELVVRVAESTDITGLWIRPLALSLVVGLLLAIPAGNYLDQRERRYRGLAQRLAGALQQTPGGETSEAELENQIDYLERQLGALDHTLTAVPASDQHLFLLLSMTRMQDWGRGRDAHGTATTLARFEGNLLGMLALYGGKPVIIDEQRILLDFGSTTPRRVRQATVFAMGVSTVLARQTGDRENEPLPVSGSLFQLPDHERLLSFAQSNRTALEARLDETEDLAAGHLLIEMALLDPSIDDLLVRVRPVQYGMCVERIEPSVLQLWEQQFNRISGQR